jgi:hypothetical protein
MKTTILTLALAAFTFASLPAMASVSKITSVTADTLSDTVDKRPRPRVKGGSGCDDPEDILEHPECR